MDVAVTPVRRLRHTIASILERSRRAPERTEDRWARIMSVSRTVDPDVNLNDDFELVGHLFSKRWRASDFDDIFDDVIDECKRQRAAGEIAI